MCEYLVIYTQTSKKYFFRQLAGDENDEKDGDGFISKSLLDSCCDLPLGVPGRT